MAKQSFTTGQVLTAAQMTALQANDYNWTVSAKTASYVLVAADAGTRITMSNAGATTITVNTALFTAGDTLTITNIGAGACTITAGTATVSTGGSLVLNQYDSGTLYFSSTGVAIWNGANPGDITGVTAGTGISGGGTSGTVTVTNSMATEITAAGDIIVGTGSGTFDNLPIGTTAQVLTADTTVSPYKVKWATPASGLTFVGAYAYSNNSSQTIPATTSTTLLLPSELYDTDSFHSTSSNTSRMTVPSGKAGKYLITAGAYLAGYTGGYARFRVFQNGTEISNYGLTSGQISALWDGTQYPLVQANLMVSAAVSDYYEIGWYNQNGSQANTYAFFGFSYLGA